MNAHEVAARRYIATVTTLAGLATAAIGIWGLVHPTSFGEFAGFGYHEHFLHDVGAFQLGLGAALLLAVLWSDALATALAGFLVANTAHTVNHAVDLDLGGSAWQAWALGAVSIAIAVAFVLRLRQLGYVVGSVGGTTEPTLAPFVRQKTILLTTFRKDGRPGSTPVSIAVDGDRAFVRSFEKSLKARRLAREPRVEFGPCSGFGTPTGTVHAGRMRRLSGQEHQHAARMLRRKYPLLHGVVVPLAHRIGRAKTGRTVHFELVPERAPAAARSDAVVDTG